MNTTIERLAALAAGPIFGGTMPTPQQGIATRGDALVTHTADGVDLASLWAALNEAFSIPNEHRTNIASLISYPALDSAVIAVVSRVNREHSCDACRLVLGLPSTCSVRLSFI